jgi:hypothetical protein
MVTEDLFILMVIATTENGSTTKPMDAEHMNIWMVQNTLATGKKINNMATELKLGQMKLNMRETTNLERNMGSELSNGQISLLILENFTIIIFMVKVCILGSITVSMKESGEQTKCMEKELLVGLMEENTSDNMPKIKKEVMENLYGQIDAATEVNG